MSKLLTNSRMKAFRACPRLEHIKYRLGYRPAVEAEELAFGTLAHHGLEAWWRCTDGNRLGAAILALRAEKADPFDLVKAEAMLMGYDARWLPDMEHYKVLHVEVRFECEVVNPETGAASRTWRLAGKLDAVARDRRNGHIVLVEHKTSSEDVSPGSDYCKRLRMDGQISVYFDGAASLGLKPDVCLYDVLGKPRQRPLEANQRRAVAETPEEYRLRLLAAITEDPNRYYSRIEAVRLEAELHGARLDTWDTGRVMRESELAERWPRNPDACQQYGRTCPFFAVCTGEASLDDARLYRQTTDVHPELGGADVGHPTPGIAKEERHDSSQANSTPTG